ncbi:hypothetical protein BP6252_02284 [Coleophoma cylindrospora]|uniref:Ras modification protein ERF4 n=1 Tax=Coleophoma cylindrospora TaxID=1849047 RepID=A0A3D8SF03_9HELO|nr:hypothetical protein BP6252_02284 [Coleophoma cylindrospora]
MSEISTKSPPTSTSTLTTATAPLASRSCRTVFPSRCIIGATAISTSTSISNLQLQFQFQSVLQSPSGADHVAGLHSTPAHPRRHPASSPPPLRTICLQSRRGSSVPTASAGCSTAHDDPPATTIDSNAEANPRIPSPTFQPAYPSPIPSPSSTGPQVRVTTPTRWNLRNALIGPSTTPFRNRANTQSSVASNRIRGLARRPSAARLWNPTNSTRAIFPESQQSRKRADSEVPAAVPLSHPGIQLKEEATAGGDYPLLTLPEQRRSRHSGSTKASLQVERSGSPSSNANRISLPRSVSIDIERRKSRSSLELSAQEGERDKGKGRAVDEIDFALRFEKEPEQKATGFRKRGQSASQGQGAATSGISISHDLKGKGKEVADMSADLERGPDIRSSYHSNRLPNVNTSNASLHSHLSGIGPALSSNNTSIIGSDGPAPEPGEEWGPQHPCFPHMNSHVPLSSPLYKTTRIIRIRRDWMIEGDLAPTFSNLYPEILDPAGVSEQDFRRLVEKVNEELVPAFNPYSPRNILDGVLGLITGWVWDDLGFTGVKSRLRNVEKFLEDWNAEMERKSPRSKDDDGPDPSLAPKIVPLRRTGYMNLDIQVPDPEILYPVPTDEGRTDTGNSRLSGVPS